jgi:pseudouridine-5'-phosphate glycosidase
MLSRYDTDKLSRSDIALVVKGRPAGWLAMAKTVFNAKSVLLEIMGLTF